MIEINCPTACGKCCEVISLTEPKRNLGIDLKILLKRISRKKAKEIRPDLTVIQGKFYYICTAFNYKTRLCAMYNGRPYMCRYYPFYDNTVIDAKYSEKDCYWANQIMKKELIKENNVSNK